MKSIKRGVAALLAALLIIPSNLPVHAEEGISEEIAAEAVAAEVIINTGQGNILLAAQDVSDNVIADDYFAEDGSYTICAEDNAFFPYEVQFTCNGETSRQWFMTPDSSVEVGGHTFRIQSEADGTQITQLSLNVGGETVVVYPEEKEFPEVGMSLFSLQPLKERSLGEVDLTAYTPMELKQVKVSAVMGSSLASGQSVMWASTAYNDDYEIKQAGDTVNLYYNVSNSYSSAPTITNEWSIIVGEGDQLAADNVRYSLPIKITNAYNWLIPEIYAQAADGTRTKVSINDSYFSSSYGTYNGISCAAMQAYVPGSEVDYSTQLYMTLAVNAGLYPSVPIIRAFEGVYDSAAAAVAGTEVTDQIFGTGYDVSLGGNSKYITLVSYDSQGNPNEYLPLRLYIWRQGLSLSSDIYNQNGRSVWSGQSSSYSDGKYQYIYRLYSGLAANDKYYVRYSISNDGDVHNELAVAAYVGEYASMDAAAGAEDIKDALFGSVGYGADYSNGVTITVFYKDAAGTVYRDCRSIKTEAVASSSTDASISFIWDSDGKSVSYYEVSSDNDSFVQDTTYITYMVGQDVKLSELAPIFWTSSSSKVVVRGPDNVQLITDRIPDKAEAKYYDFSKGAVKFTAFSEDGDNQQNYDIQIINAPQDMGNLYITSLTDPDAKTRVENGVVYSTREVMLDSYHNGDYHDIFVANISQAPIGKLGVSLESNAVELDEYWTFNGKYDLGAFDGVDDDHDADGSWISHKGLQNIGKIRLVRKTGVENGTDITGTLTIKSGDTVLMSLALTGVVGDPTITTKTIPGTVKYVPTGIAIQNSNKYSWNKVSYSLYSGELPDGMTVRPNGEIYGIPMEAGEFTFTVCMENSYSRFSNAYATFTLTVTENTDANVDGATDSGYDLTRRVPDITMNAGGEYTMRSLGGLAEFQDIYLDGVKLVAGQDYTASEGSTVITISSQTLKNSKVMGTHTLGMEFRTAADDTLKRAAQNYKLSDASSSDSGSGGSSSSGSSDGASAGSAEKDEKVNYVVVRGDTLSRIARRNGISLAQLLAWNPQIKNPNRIFPGQVIVVGHRKSAAAGVPSYADEGAAFDTVMKGDSLYRIARRNKVSLSAVIALNPEIARQKYIYAGQKVRVR